MNAGQIAVLEAWLSQYEPAEEFDTRKVHVLTTQNIIAEIDDMADFDANEVAEYLANAGFKVKCDNVECRHGWILKPKNQ